jgi:hypothetical protein
MRLVGSLVLGMVAPLAAQAARPRTDRAELVAVSEPPKPKTRLFVTDLGGGGWASSLTGLVTLELGLGLGARLGAGFFLLGEVAFAAYDRPYSGPLLRVRLGVNGTLGWNVGTLVSSLPLEFGPEVGVGVALAPWGPFAVPLVQPGLFARYVFSPQLSLGVRVRGALAWWLGYSSASQRTNTTCRGWTGVGQGTYGSTSSEWADEGPLGCDASLSLLCFEH